MTVLQMRRASSRTENPLASKAIDHDLQDLAIAVQALEGYALVAQSQPIGDGFDDPTGLLRDVRRHSLAVRRHSATFLNRINPQMRELISFTGGYANLIESACESLEPTLVIGGAGRTRDHGRELFEGLAAEADRFGSLAEGLTIGVSMLTAQLRMDADNLTADTAAAVDAISSELGEQARLQQAVAAAQQGARTASAGLIGAIIGGGVAAGLLAVATIVTLPQGVAPALIGIGVTGGLGSGGAAVAEGVALANANAKLRAAWTALAGIDRRLALLRGIEDQTDALAEAAEQLGASLCRVTEGWVGIAGDINRFVGRLESMKAPASAADIAQIVNAAKRDWQRVRDEVKRLQGVLVASPLKSQAPTAA